MVVVTGVAGTSSHDEAPHVHGASAEHHDKRRAEAGMRLVGRGLVESMLAGAAVGPAVLLVSLLVGVRLDLGLGPVFDEVVVVGVLVLSVVVGTVLGLGGGVLALALLGVVTRADRVGWTASTAGWLVPAGVVGLATIGAAVGADFWAYYAAALPAAVLTAWRARRANPRFREKVVLP